MNLKLRLNCTWRQVYSVYFVSKANFQIKHKIYIYLKFYDINRPLMRLGNKCKKSIISSNNVQYLVVWGFQVHVISKLTRIYTSMSSLAVMGIARNFCFISIVACLIFPNPFVTQNSVTLQKNGKNTCRNKSCIWNDI